MWLPGYPGSAFTTPPSIFTVPGSIALEADLDSSLVEYQTCSHWSDAVAVGSRGERQSCAWLPCDELSLRWIPYGAFKTLGSQEPPEELWKCSLPNLTPRNSDVGLVRFRNFTFSQAPWVCQETKLWRTLTHRVSLWHFIQKNFKYIEK